MSIERQIIIRVRDFMKYWHPQIPRQLPEAARIEYNLLHEVIDLYLAPKAEPVKPVKAEPVKPAKKKKVSKKK